MKTKTLFFIFLLFFLCSITAFALEFSANMVSTTQQGSFSGKIYVSDKKIRTEMAGAISIVRLDRDIAWIIMPGQNMYMEQPIDPQMIRATSDKMPGEIERTLLGKEIINGRQVDKYRVIYTSLGKRETVLQWLDTATSIPIKVTDEKGSWSFEYKNLKIGPQNASLFEVPAGYAKFSMGNMAEMAKQFKQQADSDFAEEIDE